MTDIDLVKLKADIALRKSMPDFGPETSIKRLRIINDTMVSFTPEVVEELIVKLEAEQHERSVNWEAATSLAEENGGLKRQAEAAQRERDAEVLLRLEVSGALSSATARYEAAEAELKRRDEMEPVAWQFLDAGEWHTGSEKNNHRQHTEAAGYPVRNLYATAPATVHEGKPIARIIKPGPNFKGICETVQARTYAEFPKSEVENSDGYWEEGGPLYAAAPAAVPEKVVKLPSPLMPAQHNSGELFMTPDNVCSGGYLNRDDVERCLLKVGVKWVEGE